MSLLLKVERFANALVTALEQRALFGQMQTYLRFVRQAQIRSQSRTARLRPEMSSAVGAGKRAGRDHGRLHRGEQLGGAGSGFEVDRRAGQCVDRELVAVRIVVLGRAWPEVHVGVKAAGARVLLGNRRVLLEIRALGRKPEDDPVHESSPRRVGVAHHKRVFLGTFKRLPRKRRRYVLTVASELLRDRITILERTLNGQAVLCLD